jgi:acetyl-CoA carboxylase carboxyltransferase component
MCGKAYDPYFIAAWPQARYCVMGPEQAAGTITEVRAASLKRRGEAVDEAELQAFYKEVHEKYQRETDPLYAASRLWIDALIDPRETRRFLSVALECASHRTDLEPLRTGVFQT